MKSKRAPLKFEKIKSEFGGKYPKQFEANSFLFKNPIFEHYFTSYMEQTQKDLNEYITLDQFKSIAWTKGLPVLIIEIMGYLTGEPDETYKFFEDAISYINELQ